MAYQLVMKTGPAPGKIFTLENTEIAIGREAGSDVYVNDVEVSRQHARLLSQFGDYLLEDLDSTNGTFVNGQRITGQRILKPGTPSSWERVSAFHTKKSPSIPTRLRLTLLNHLPRLISDNMKPGLHRKRSIPPRPLPHTPVRFLPARLNRSSLRRAIPGEPGYGLDAVVVSCWYVFWSVQLSFLTPSISTALPHSAVPWS